ncbi:hypothetical protein HDU92_005545 [Lobulomyces angularis]|nr:hypothetical protein HDU92_005545 [Lobulomyces angularis]
MDANQQFNEQTYQNYQQGYQHPPQGYHPQQQQIAAGSLYVNQQEYQQQPGQPPFVNQQQFQYQQYQQSLQQQNLPSMPTYQSHVAGLNGWNDPPKKSTSEEDDFLLDGIESPSGLIVSTLETCLEKVNMKILPGQKKLIEDTEKRLELLFDDLASEKISKPILAKLVVISKALTANDFQKASTTIMSIMTGNFNVEDRWVLGLKRLIDFYPRCL